ncbi:oxidoreductase-like domain-containing protein [Ramlibacter rhizophilus]|uniref:Oxidoreductase-like domain-containing protein n=1 Tax=Ramlibacter rhizophilus TaxID=1781167 RepID=A0A4Z0BPU4_9BURK|nr:oxidoreductase-like domain-containing protein [Ramlibacter rhizophilus]TFZ01317.1 hypothetical protein EZ242_08010 [Ramlibacter rhizophilus]
MSSPPLGDLAIARARIANLQARLSAAQVAFRAPPPEPDTCCGRGCNGCVWEGFYEALDRWLEEGAARVDDVARERGRA